VCLTASIVNGVVVRVRAVVATAGHEDHQQHVLLFSRDRQGTSVPSSTRVPRWQLLKVCASFGRPNARAIGNQVDAVFIFARVDFVKVHRNAQRLAREIG
jgi:hypothetical protein